MKTLHLALALAVLLPLPLSAQTYRIDMGNITPAEAGFVRLVAGHNSAVIDSGVTFTLFDEDTGDAFGILPRDRGGPDLLLRDFALIAGVAAKPLGLRIAILPAGYYEAQSWHHDNNGLPGTQNVSLRPMGGAAELVASGTLIGAAPGIASPARFSFVADGSTTYELLAGGAESTTGAYFNGIELTRVTFPTGLTYVDANDGNTQAEGGSPSPFSTPTQGLAAGTNLWWFRPGLGFDEAGNNGIYEKDGTGTGGDGARLVTTITGLTPGAEHKIYVCFLSDPAPADWHIQAGLSPGALTVFTRSSPDVINMGPASVGGQEQLVALVGTATADFVGRIPVYTDDVTPDTAEASWFDGVAYEEIVPLAHPHDAHVVADDGVWTWFNEDRAIYHGGLLFAGYARSDGEVGVSRYDPVADSKAETVLSTPASVQVDDHNNPSLTVLPDGKVLAVYSKHGGGAQYFQRTSLNTAPGSLADWGPEVTVSVPGANNTYSNTFRLSGESDKLYNFHRHLGFDPNYSTSTNNGTTWTHHGIVISRGNDTDRPYVRYVSNDTDRIDLIYTDGHPNDFVSPTSVYHLYYKAGAFHNTDDSASKTLAQLPYLHDSGERGTVVYQHNAAAWGASDGPDDWIPDGRSWTWDVQHDSTTGNPLCVFSVQKANLTGLGWHHGRIYYYYARWTGTAWEKHFIAHAGRPLYRTEDHYAGGITVDPDDTRIVYLSTNALNPFDLSKANAFNVPLNPDDRYEIWRGITHDGGATFLWSPVTQDSESDNLRPFVANDHGHKRHLVWLHGRYTTFVDYKMYVLGLFDSDFQRYGDWATYHQLAPDMPGLNSDTDSLNDGYEYLFDLDPHVDDADPVMSDAGGLSFTLPVLRGDATVLIERSSDSVNWFPIATAPGAGEFFVDDVNYMVSQTGGPPNAVEVVLPPETRYFLRLVIELDPVASQAYMTWATGHGLAAYAPHLDTDDDGLTDGFEYLFDLDPNEPDSTGAMAYDAAGLHFTLPVSRPDAIVHIQRSGALTDWSAVATSVGGAAFSLLDTSFTLNQSGGASNAVDLTPPPASDPNADLRLMLELDL